MILLSELLGHDAVSLRTAATTGKVKAIRVERNKISHVELSHTVIPAGSVRSFDGDVLTYDYDDAAPIEKPVTGDPRKRLLLDCDGNAHGTITDLTIAADGTIEFVTTDNDEQISGSRLQAVGPYAAIITTTKTTP